MFIEYAAVLGSYDVFDVVFWVLACVSLVGVVGSFVALNRARPFGASRFNKFLALVVGFALVGVSGFALLVFSTVEKSKKLDEAVAMFEDSYSVIVDRDTMVEVLSVASGDVDSFSFEAVDTSGEVVVCDVNSVVSDFSVSCGFPGGDDLNVVRENVSFSSFWRLNVGRSLTLDALASTPSMFI